MEKDRRTDNWGGYHDYNRDPRQYHFPRSTKELGWGEYRPQFKGFKRSPIRVDYLMIVVFAIIIYVFYRVGVF